MKSKTRKRLERKWENLPRCFLDSSIFLEVIMKQPNAAKCKKIFNIAGCKYRLETSTFVLGEVVRGIYRFMEHKAGDEALILLNYLLRDKHIVVHTPSKSCITMSVDMLDLDTFLGPVDALIFSNCVENSCKAFFTQDTDFSEKLGLMYGVKINKI
ncbi:MAG: PIN domain-containing protein [Candidatus Woesearchaeota archaeon]